MPSLHKGDGDILSRLPPELSSMVLRYLEAKELGACARVSKSWRRMTNDEFLWRRWALDLATSSDEDFSDLLSSGSSEEGKDPDVLEEQCYSAKIYGRALKRIDTNWREGRHRRFTLPVGPQEQGQVVSSSGWRAPYLALAYSSFPTVELYRLSPGSPRHVASLVAPLEAPVTCLAISSRLLVAAQADFVFFYSLASLSVVDSCVVLSSPTATCLFFSDPEDAAEIDNRHDNTMFVDFLAVADSDTLYIVVGGELLVVNLRGERPREELRVPLPDERHLYVEENGVYLFDGSLRLLASGTDIRLQLWGNVTPYRVLANGSVVVVLVTDGQESSHALQAYDASTGERLVSKYTGRALGSGLHPGRDTAVVVTAGGVTAICLRGGGTLWTRAGLLRVDCLAQALLRFPSKSLVAVMSREDWAPYSLLHVVDLHTGTALYALEILTYRLVASDSLSLAFVTPNDRVEIITYA